MHRFVLFVAGLALLAGVAATMSGGGTQVEARWVITDLGTLGGEESWAAAINERGQIIGNRLMVPYQVRPFLWQNGKMRDLGTLGGEETRAAAINERGQIVGVSATKAKDAEGFQIDHAFLWENGKMRDLGTLLGEGHGYAIDINDRGQIIGGYDTKSGAFLLQNGRVRDLGTLGGKYSEAVAINDRGQVIGQSDTKAKDADGYQISHAFLWENGKMRDLGTPRGEGSVAVAINERGQIIGNRYTKSGSRAFLWQNGRMRNLPGRGSWAAAINEHVQIIGSAWRGAFLWQNGKIQYLVSPGSNTEATAINEHGQVIGYRWSKLCSNGAAGWTEEPIPHPFVWANGKMTALPTLGGGTGSTGPPYENGGFPDDVMNDHGQIVGWSATGQGDDDCHLEPAHAVLWTLRRGT
jgi:probable HAF family extracellular repeat protein